MVGKNNKKYKTNLKYGKCDNKLILNEQTIISSNNSLSLLPRLACSL
jgi:hypothetical protein